MQVIPGLKLSKCPCCGSVNIIRINGAAYINNFKSLKSYTLKKIFNCRKCKEQIGFFSKETENGYTKNTETFWLEDVKCNEKYYETLKKLDDTKLKNIKSKNKKYHEALKEIDSIHKLLRDDKVKLRIKLKIQKKGMLIRHVY